MGKWYKCNNIYSALGPTSLTPDNAKIIGPSVWLINTNKIGSNTENMTESAAATMIIAPTQSPDGNGIYKPASDTIIVKRYMLLKKILWIKK